MIALKIPRMGDGRSCGRGDGDGVLKRAHHEYRNNRYQHPTPIDAPDGHGVPGQQIRVKFYPGLGYAPCINLETLNGENRLKIG